MGPLIPFLGAVLFGTAAGASAAYVLAVNLARFAILSLASKLAAPKIDLTQSAANKMLTIRSTVQPQSFTYGEDMLSGALIFANTTGNANKELTRLVAMHGREIDSYLAFRIDDTDIVIGVDIASDSAPVTGGIFDGVMSIDTKLGSLTQTAIADLVARYPTLWLAGSHRARGWSLLYTRMTFEGANDAYQNGIPQNMRAKVRGHRLYDPRLDDTNGGTGPQRLADDTTWTFSSNPALALTDFLRFENVGYGEDDDRIDYPLVIIAADICDELVAVPVASTQKRYTCNFTFLSTTPRQQIKEMLETAMLGRSIFSQGVWKIFAGAAQTSDVTLTEANLSGDIQLQASSSSTDRYNRVRGKFVDPTRNYTANAYPEQRNALFEAEDNVVKYQVFDVNTCNNSFEAQRDAIIKLRQSRLQRVMVFPGNWSCFRIQPGTVVEIDIAELGFNGEKFFVTQWSLQTDASGVELILVEEVDSVWNDPLESDYTIRTPTGELIFSLQGVCSLTDAFLNNFRENPQIATAGIRLNENGQLEYALPDGTFSTAGVPNNEWMIVADDYFVKTLQNSGDPLATGLLNVCEPLAVSRDWTVTAGPSKEIKTANLTVTIYTDDICTIERCEGDFDITAESDDPPPFITFNKQPYDNTITGPASGFCRIDFGSTGLVVLRGDVVKNQDAPPPSNWFSAFPQGGIGATHEVRSTGITTDTIDPGGPGAPHGFSGGFPTGSGVDGIGTFVDIAVTRVWSVGTVFGTGTVIAGFELRKIGDPASVISCQMTFVVL